MAATIGTSSGYGPRNTDGAPRLWQAGGMRRLILLLLAVLAVACASPASDGSAPAPSSPILVAGGPDTESVLLAHVAVALLQAHDLEGEVVPFADSRDARQALQLGAVDARIGYTGETWLEGMERPNPPGDPYDSFVGVRDHDAERGIIWLRPSFGDGLQSPPANATFAFFVQGPPSVDADVTTMSQLASRLSAQPDALVCVDREFASRPDGLQAVLSAYSVRSDRSFLAADPEEAMLGVAAGDCLAGLSTATDGQAWRIGLRPLTDDLRVFPAFVPVPQVREESLQREPRIGVSLRYLAQGLSTSMLGQWNARVRGGEAVELIAADAAEELISAARGD